MHRDRSQRPGWPVCRLYRRAQEDEPVSRQGMVIPERFRHCIITPLSWKLKPALTPRQWAILDFLRRWEAQPGGYKPPSIREIQAGTEMSSTSVVRYVLRQLEGQGRVTLKERTARTVRTTGK